MELQYSANLEPTIGNTIQQVQTFYCPKCGRIAQINMAANIAYKECSISSDGPISIDEMLLDNAINFKLRCDNKETCSLMRYVYPHHMPTLDSVIAIIKKGYEVKSVIISKHKAFNASSMARIALNIMVDLDYPIDDFVIDKYTNPDFFDGEFPPISVVSAIDENAAVYPAQHKKKIVISINKDYLKSKYDDKVNLAEYQYIYDIFIKYLNELADKLPDKSTT